MNIGAWLGKLFGGNGSRDPSHGRGPVNIRRRRRKSVRRGPMRVKGGWRAKRTPWLVAMRKGDTWKGILRERLDTIEIRQMEKEAERARHMDESVS